MCKQLRQKLHVTDFEMKPQAIKYAQNDDFLHFHVLTVLKQVIRDDDGFVDKVIGEIV